MTDKIEQLAKLNDLKEKGVISEKEFEKSKQDILNGISSENSKSSQSKMTALLLCIFLGCIGAHRFYTGHNVSGVLYILTFGLLGIGVLVDFISIICGTFRDKNGKTLV